MARAGQGVYPKLHELWLSVQERFGLSGIPLHIWRGAPRPALLRGGNAQPVVVLDADLLTALPEREMEALLLTQAGSVRLGNATLVSAADMVRWFLDYYGIVGAPVVLPAWGLENWRRYALFSADRAAALALGGPEAVFAWLERSAGAAENAWGGVPRPDDLRVQGLEAVSRQDEWSGSKMMRRLALAMRRGNTVSLVRRVDLADWFATGMPAKVLSGEISDPEQADVNAGGDPSAAYWGEFAGCCGDDEEEEPSGVAGVAAQAASQAFGELKDSAEKGLGTLFRAGEAFWTTLTENGKKK